MSTHSPKNLVFLLFTIVFSTACRTGKLEGFDALEDGDVVQEVLDNDGDGLIDADDPGCNTGTDNDETDPSTQCNDTMDNDGDGWIDLDDPICTSIGILEENDGYDLTGTQCNDGIDNDFDGKIDSQDPQCVSAAHVSESQ